MIASRNRQIDRFAASAAALTIAAPMGRIPPYAAAVLLTAATLVAAQGLPEPSPRAGGGDALQQPTSQSWELRGRDWLPTGAVHSDVPADPDLDRIEQLVTRRSGKAAFKEAVRWFKLNPRSPQRDRGLMLAARALFLSGDRIKAFYYCDELLDTFPESPYYQPALELQYQIADEYLKGYKRKFLGIPVIDAEDEAIEMLFRLQQRSPGSQLAERALLRTADYFYADGQYDLAGDAYAAYARSYPRSPELSRVRLRQAWSYLAQFRDAKFDATPVIDARAQLTDLMASNPQLAEEENIGALVDRIDSSLAEKLNVTANYYRRAGKPASAAYLYEQVLKTYPNTPEAERARAALERLPASAREPVAPPQAPQLPPGEDAAPSTAAPASPRSAQVTAHAR